MGIALYHSKALFKGWGAHHKILISIEGPFAINKKCSSVCKVEQWYTLCTGAFLYVLYRFLSISNKFWFSSLLHCRALMARCNFRAQKSLNVQGPFNGFASIKIITHRAVKIPRPLIVSLDHAKCGNFFCTRSSTLCQCRYA